MLLAEPRSDEAVAKFGGVQKAFLGLKLVPLSAVWAWACFLRMAFLSVVLQQVVKISYLDPKTPIGKLLSVDGCQVIVAERGYK